MAGGEKEKLEAVIRQMTALLRQVSERGMDVTPQEREEFFGELLAAEGLPRYTFARAHERLTELEADPGAVITGSVALGQGMLLGLADELASLVGERGEVQRLTKLGRKERPLQSAGLSILGGLLMPGLGSLQTLKTPLTTGRAMMNAVKIGVAEGAVVGAAESEGLVGRIRGGLAGAGVGAVVSPVLAGVAGVGTSLFRRILGRTGSTQERLVREAAQKGVARESPRSVEQIIAQLERGIRRKPGEMIPADLRELRDIGEATARVSPEAREAAEKVLLPRMHEATQRIQDDILRGIRVDSPPSMLARAIDFQGRLTMGSEAYEQLAHTITEVDDPVIMGMLQLPLMREMFERAVARARRVDRPLRQIYKEVEGELVPAGELPDFMTLQAIKKSLEDEVSSLFRAGKPGEAKEIKEVFNRYYDRVLEVVSGYGEAQKTWADLARERDALEAGMNYWQRSTSVEEALHNLETLSGGALTSYREGAVHRLLERLQYRSRTGDPTKVFDVPAVEEKLRGLFPTDESFAAFLDDLAMERGFYRTARPYVSGRGKATSIAELLDLGLGRRELQRYFEIPVVAELGIMRAAGGGVQRVLGRKEKAIERAVSGQLGRILYTPQRDVSAVRDLLTGEARRLGAVPGFEAMMRSPRALFQALYGGTRGEEKPEPRTFRGFR